MAWEIEVAELVHNGTLTITPEGHVYRHKRTNRYGAQTDLMTPRRIDMVNSQGYRRMTIQIGGKARSVNVHRFVWHMANGPIPPGLQINHLNSDKADNRIDNLATCTPSENIRHYHSSGTTPTTWRGKPRVTVGKAQTVRAMRSDGVLFKDIAAATGLSVSHAHRIYKKGTPGCSLIDIPAAAERLGTTTGHIRRLVRCNELPHTRLGKLIRFDPDTLDQWVTDNTMSVRCEDGHQTDIVFGQRKGYTLVTRKPAG